VKAAPFDLVRARTVDEVVALLTREEGVRVLAGGQSLLPLLAQRKARPTVLVDVNGLDLGQVGAAAGGRLRLGALVRLRQLELDPSVASTAPLLAEAAGLIGYPSIRNRGTLGGSLAHADPVAELPAALVALGGSVVAVGPGGHRTIDAADLFVGRFATSLADDELLVEVSVPAAHADDGHAFCEWSPRTSDFALAGVAMVVGYDDDGTVAAARAAACGVGGAPLDLTPAVAALVGSGPTPSDGLLRELSASVQAACAGDEDRAQLTGLLAARAAWRAAGRAAVRRPAVRAQPATTMVTNRTEDGSRQAVRPKDGGPPSCPGSPTSRDLTDPGVAAWHRVTLVVNGQPAEVDVEPRTTLLDALRTQLGLTGAHAGCEYGSCGACTVLVDGATSRSCLVLAVQAEGASVTTIEGLGTPDDLHPVMDALRRHHGLQCGYCTPAVVLATLELLADDPVPTEDAIRIGLSGNLCRCTGYSGIVDAVVDIAASDWVPTVPGRPVTIGSGT